MDLFDKIEIYLIDGDIEALAISKLRNKYCEYMTHSTTKISPEQQMDWYHHTYIPENERGNIFAYIGYSPLIKSAAAYGLITKHEHGIYSVTGILDERVRGKGFGKTLFEFLETEIKNKGGKMIILDVWSWNKVARSLYEKLGFEYNSGNPHEGILVMTKALYER